MRKPEETTVPLREELEAVYARVSEAYRTRNADAVMRFTAPEFAQQMPDGTIIRREDAEAGLRAWFETADTVESHSTEVRGLSVRGETVLAEVEEQVRTRFTDEQGTPHTREQRNAAQVGWKHTAEGWRIASVQYVTGLITVDGRPVQALFTE